MDLRRLLLQRHSEELLVELRRPVKVGHAYRHVVYADGLELCLSCRRLSPAHQRGERNGELAAGQHAAFEIAKHRFYGSYHWLLHSLITTSIGTINTLLQPVVALHLEWAHT